MLKRLTQTTSGVAPRLTSWLRATLLSTLLCLSLVMMAIPAAHASTTHVSHPQTSVVICDGGQNLTIFYDNYQYEICFAGSGYIGYGISNVSEIDNWSTKDSWVRVYENGTGWYQYVDERGVCRLWPF